MDLFGKPRPIELGDTTFEGVSGAHARADHRHGMGPVLRALLAKVGVSAPGTITTVTNTTTVTASPVEKVNTATATDPTLTLPDVTVATVHYVTLNVNCTFLFPSISPGKSFTLVLVQDGTGTRTVTWPTSVVWAGGTAPVLTTTASKRDVFSFLSADGVTWQGFMAGFNYS